MRLGRCGHGLLLIPNFQTVASFHSTARDAKFHQSHENFTRRPSPLLGFAVCPPLASNPNTKRTRRHASSDSTDDDKKPDEIPVRNERIDSTESDIVPLADRTAVLGYRLALILTSLGFGASASVPLLQGSGLAAETIRSLQESSLSVIGLGSCVTAMIVPSYLATVADPEIDDSRNSFLALLDAVPRFLGGLALIAGLIGFLGDGFVSPSDENIEKVAFFFVIGICFREIAFYGLAYKVEAVFAVAFVAFKLSAGGGLSQAAFSGGLALSLLVLSVGKVFEPIRSDIQADQSAFFLDDRDR